MKWNKRPKLNRINAHQSEVNTRRVPHPQEDENLNGRMRLHLSLGWKAVVCAGGGLNLDYSGAGFR